MNKKKKKDLEIRKMQKLPQKNKLKFKKRWTWIKLQSIFKLGGLGSKWKENYLPKKEKEKKVVKRERKRSEYNIFIN